MLEDDRVDRYCNQIHVACIGLQRLKRQAPYYEDMLFLQLMEEFCLAGKHLMELIREREAQRARSSSQGLVL